MAYRRDTIVKRMLEKSGKTTEEVSGLVGKESDYVDRVLSGEVRPSTNTLDLIATQCGYELAFVGYGETLELASVLIPDANKEARFAGSYQCSLTGKGVGATGGVFSLDDDSLASLFDTLGATYYPRFGKKTCDVLVIGDVSSYKDGRTRSMDNADRWGKEQITAAQLRDMYLDLTGVDIAL